MLMNSILEDRIVIDCIKAKERKKIKEKSNLAEPNVYVPNFQSLLRLLTTFIVKDELVLTLFRFI